MKNFLDTQRLNYNMNIDKTYLTDIVITKQGNGKIVSMANEQF